jgi:hypothetical protein
VCPKTHQRVSKVAYTYTSIGLDEMTLFPFPHDFRSNPIAWACSAELLLSKEPATSVLALLVFSTKTRFMKWSGEFNDGHVVA